MSQYSHSHFKAQMVLLVILLVAMADFFIGCLLAPTAEQMAKGFVGWRGKDTFFSPHWCLILVFTLFLSSCVFFQCTHVARDS